MTDSDAVRRVCDVVDRYVHGLSWHTWRRGGVAFARTKAPHGSIEVAANSYARMQSLLLADRSIRVVGLPGGCITATHDLMEVCVERIVQRIEARMSVPHG